MEVTAYAELKAKRNAARSDSRQTSRILWNLKFALADLPEDSTAHASITDIREGLKEVYGEQKAARKDLEAQVTAAREEYRKENPKPVYTPSYSGW